MNPDPDEIAGVVDLFGGLTRDELREAVADLAARSGEPFDADALSAAVDRSVADYYLVAVESGAIVESERETGSERERKNETTKESESESEINELLVAGPTSLPRLPDGGEDLPHLLDVERRSVDPESVRNAALARLHGDAARAVNDGDEELIGTLLDVCYELEAWAPVETAELRERLDAGR